MTFEDILDIISFAKQNDLMHKPFLEVYDLYLQDIESKLEDMLQENSIFSIEIEK